VWSVIVTNEWGHEVTEILVPSQSSGPNEPERKARAFDMGERQRN
jgi:hypothetical protein